MAKKPNDWMPLDVRKYLGDTMHLGRDQHGGYLLLIMAYWMRGGPLGDNDRELAAIVRAGLPDWKRLRPILAAFFEVAGGKWVHHKIEKELARAKEIIEKKTAAGKQGAEKRWGTDSEPDSKPIADAIADASQTDAPLPLPVPLVEKENIPARKRAVVSGAEASTFQEFWDAYPNSKGRKPAVKAYNTALPKASAEILLAGAKRYAREVSGVEKRHIKHAQGWLTDERWSDGSESRVIRPSAFNSPEEIEAQRLLKEKYLGQA